MTVADASRSEYSGRVPASRPVVLVVDDDPRNRELLRARLEGTYEVVEADSGRAALDLLDGVAVDLVLLDVMMPELNGFDTCKAIKARQHEGFLPVILLTALSGQDDRNQGLAAGADEFLSKPVDRLELSLRVQSLLRVRRQEEQLRRHTDDLEHLQALKDDLFSLIMHDMRNPLTGVLGYIDLLQTQLQGPALGKARAYAERAAEGGRKLRDLLEEVLEVRRLEEDALPLRLEHVRVDEVARDAARSLEGAAQGRRIRVEVRAGSAPALPLDRSLLRRALENLIANAIKFSPPDEAVEVDVRSHGGTLSIEVSDRGAGIADSTKLKLFGKFASVDARSSGDRRRGFGLGLHLVKLVADAHGGGAFVRDRDGGGSVFGLWLREPVA